MAKRNVEMMKQAEPAITRGTGNVFADLGYVDAEERQTKLRLAHAINGVIARQRLSEAAAALHGRCEGRIRQLSSMSVIVSCLLSPQVGGYSFSWQKSRSCSPDHSAAS
jgi:hypothetical protein